ncbi:hypothetical protein [Candidatus Rariloculus sp.]|uniref:hypothetical protein n=1 Tax=Candidatus Rariloculus sp. TaxID=3101265 RepID=UPI003D0F98C1
MASKSVSPYVVGASDDAATTLSDNAPEAAWDWASEATCGDETSESEQADPISRAIAQTSSLHMSMHLHSIPIVGYER